MLPLQDVPLRTCPSARGNVLYIAEDGNLAGTGTFGLIFNYLCWDFTPAASANPAETEQRGTTTSDLNCQCRVEVVQERIGLEWVELPAAELCPEAALHQWGSSQQGGQCVQLPLALGTASCPGDSAGTGCAILEWTAAEGVGTVPSSRCWLCCGTLHLDWGKF